MDKESAKREIGALVDRYVAIDNNKNELNLYNEEMTKIRFINPLFSALGWDLENKNRKDEVTFEEKVSKGRADYAFRINGISRFYLEAKSIRSDIDDNDYAKQVIEYAWNKGCTWAILTNFKKIRVFNSEMISDVIAHMQFFEIAYKDFISNFDQLFLLSKLSLEYGLLDKEAETWGKKAKRITVDKQLLSDFTRFREILSKNITKLNRSMNLTQEQLDEGTQRILDRLIFIRYCEDKKLEERKLISNAREWRSSGRGQLVGKLREVFAYFDRLYDSKIFDKAPCDQLEIDDEILYEIIEGLHFRKDRSIPYDFSAIEADVLGSIYEQYLGHILKKTAKTAKLAESQAHRKEQGIYYTPTFIVDYIIQNTLVKLLRDKKINPDKLRVLDMACGSGSFLIKAFDVLNDYHLKHDKDYSQTTLDATVDTGTYTTKLKILQNNIFGVDLDKQAIEVAQLNLLLKVAEKGLRLPLLQQNVKQGNSLIENSFVIEDRAFDWQKEFPEIMAEGGFDVIVGNPPYVKLQALNKNQVDYFYSNYKAATKHYDIYTLFVERGLSLLKEGGILGFILPSKFLNADYGIGLRHLLAGKMSIAQIVNFGDFQVFDGATTYTCLLFLRKVKNKTFEYHELYDKKKLGESKALSADLFKYSLQPQPHSAEEWRFGSGDSHDLKKKLDRIRLKLGDISKDIFQGILTGRDKFFFVNIVEAKGTLVKVTNSYDNVEHIIEKSLLRKLLKGKEIRRWQIDWTGSYVIYPYEVVAEVTKLIPIDKMKSRFPRTYQYLLNYKKELMNSDTTEVVDQTNWYRCRRARSIEQFEQPKILTQVLASSNSFSLDHKGEYYFVGGGNAGGFGIILKDEYVGDYAVIMALLNSKLQEFYLKKISTPFRGGFYSYGKRFIDKLPIIFPSGEEKRTLHDLASRQLEKAVRLNAMSSKITDEGKQLKEEMMKTEIMLNEHVFRIYDINEEEQKIVEDSIKKK